MIFSFISYKKTKTPGTNQHLKFLFIFDIEKPKNNQPSTCHPKVRLLTNFMNLIINARLFFGRFTICYNYQFHSRFPKLSYF